MKPTLSDVRKALLSMDETIIPLQLIKQVLVYLPTEDEQKALKKFKNDIPSNLSLADRFLLEVMQIDRYEFRIKALIFKANFDEKLRDLQNESERLLAATTALLNNASNFDNIMHIVLVIGNVMNGNNFRGGAFGFKLSGMNVIMDTKSTSDRFSTLLHYLAFVVETQFPSYMSFIEDLSPVFNACRVSSQSVLKDSQALHTDMQNISGVISNAASDDILATTFGPFVRRATLLEKSVFSKIKLATGQYERCLTKYGEDAGEQSSEEFFSIFKTFMASFTKALADNRIPPPKKKAEVLPTLSTIDENTALAVERFKASTSQEGFVLDLSDSDKKGVMDHLLDSLKKGTIKNTSRSTLAGQARRPQGQDQSTKPWRRVSINQVSLQAESLLNELQSV